VEAKAALGGGAVESRAVLDCGTNNGTSPYPVRTGLHQVQLQIDRSRSESLKVDVATGATVVLECRARNPLSYPYSIMFGHHRHIELRAEEA
jgi:hypothetical protein